MSRRCLIGVGAERMRWERGFVGAPVVRLGGDLPTERQ